MRKHPCWKCHILQESQTANKLWLCLCVVLSRPSLPFSLSLSFSPPLSVVASVIYFFHTPVFPSDRRPHTRSRSARQTISSSSSVAPVVALPLHFPLFVPFLTSYRPAPHPPSLSPYTYSALPSSPGSCCSSSSRNNRSKGVRLLFA